MPLDLDTPDEFTELSAMIKGFSNDTRLALLLGFRHGYTVQEIADFLEITRGGLQNNIYKMIDADLVYRPAGDEAPAYRLTPIGQFIARFMNQHGEALLEARNLLATTEEQLTRELAESSLAEGLSDTEAEKLIHTKKWADAGDDVATLLKQSGTTPYAPPEQAPEDLTHIILDRVAEREGIDISDLPALNTVINPEALQTMFSGQNPRPEDHIQFTYLDYTVTVTATGEVDVSNGSTKGVSMEN